MEHLTLDSKIPYGGLIVCDACQQATPTSRCGRCRTRFYCSVACQKKDWVNDHKYVCRMRAALPLRPGPPVPIVHDQDARNTDCGICLVDPIPRPVVLPGCQHAFCGPCVIRWNERLTQEQLIAAEVAGQDCPKIMATTCPLCRKVTPGHVMDRMVVRVDQYGKSASHPSLSLEQKQEYREAALRECDKFAEDRESMTAQLMLARVSLLLSLNRGQEALDALEERERISAKRARIHAKVGQLVLRQIGIAKRRGGRADMTSLEAQMDEIPPLSHDSISDAAKDRIFEDLLRSKALMMVEKYSEAYKSFESVLRGNASGDINDKDLVTIRLGMAEALYHLGQFQSTIETIDKLLVLESYRMMYESHKWKALSQKALGQLEEAIKTMKIAVIHEAPWDDDNRAKNIQLHNELVDEKLAMEQHEGK